MNKAKLLNALFWFFTIHSRHRASAWPLYRPDPYSTL